MIIGIAAKKQCGKDSMAKFIEELLPDKKVARFSFAFPLKNFCHETFLIPKNHLFGSDSEKNFPLMTWGEVFTGLALSKYGKRNVDLLSAREILQVVGTDVMRQGNLNYLYPQYEKQCVGFVQKWFGKDARPFDSIWIDMAIKDINLKKHHEGLDVAVISDVRFHNERLAIADAGGMNIRLYRDTRCEDSIPHPSELELDEMRDQDFDYVLTERENKNLKALKLFTTRVLMERGLIHMGGIAL